MAETVKTATITAIPMVGLTALPKARFTVTEDITDDLPAEAIGQVVAEAVQRAWRAGQDPAAPGFSILVTFGKK